MESRERVMLALGHQRPDRVPINFRGVPRVVETVSQALGTDYEGLLQHWGVDFREIIPPYIGPSFAAREDGAEVDYWGVGRSLVEHADGGRDVMVSYSPLKDATTVEDVETRRTIDEGLRTSSLPYVPRYSPPPFARSCSRRQSLAGVPTSHSHRGWRSG